MSAEREQKKTEFLTCAAGITGFVSFCYLSLDVFYTTLNVCSYSSPPQPFLPILQPLLPNLLQITLAHPIVNGILTILSLPGTALSLGIAGNITIEAGKQASGKIRSFTTNLSLT
jgi:hypothetical protein